MWEKKRRQDLFSVVDGEINRAVSLGCLGLEVSMYKYQPDAEIKT
jgi:hypothetical protein